MWFGSKRRSRIVELEARVATLLDRQYSDARERANIKERLRRIERAIGLKLPDIDDPCPNYARQLVGPTIIEALDEVIRFVDIEFQHKPATVGGYTAVPRDSRSNT